LKPPKILKSRQAYFFEDFVPVAQVEEHLPSEIGASQQKKMLIVDAAVCKKPLSKGNLQATANYGGVKKRSDRRHSFHQNREQPGSACEMVS